MLLKYPRILMEEAGAASGGGAPPPGPSKAEAELAAAQAKLADAEKRERERLDAEAAAHKRAMDADAARKALTDKEAELKATNARIAEYEKREEERAARMLEQLPKETQERLAKYKDSFATKGAWYDMITDEVQRAQSGTAPAFGSPGGIPHKDIGYQPSKQAQEFLDGNYYEKGNLDFASKNLNAARERDEATGQISNKFYINPKMLFQRIKKGPVSLLNQVNATERLTGKSNRGHKNSGG